jgi:hypothetical protein
MKSTYTIEEHTAGEWRLFRDGKLFAVFPASIRNDDRDAKKNAEFTCALLNATASEIKP